MSFNAKPTRQIKRLMFSASVGVDAQRVTPLYYADLRIKAFQEPTEEFTGSLLYFDLMNLASSGDLQVTQDPLGFVEGSGNTMANWITIPPGGVWSCFTRDIAQQGDETDGPYFFLRASTGTVTFTGSVEFWVSKP